MEAQQQFEQVSGDNEGFAFSNHGNAEESFKDTDGHEDESWGEGVEVPVVNAGGAVVNNNNNGEGDEFQNETSEEIIQRLLAEAYEQLPQTLLHYDDPVQLMFESRPPMNDQERMQALAPYLSPLIRSQTEVISDRPVVTSTDKILNAVLPPRTFSVFDETSQSTIEFVQCVRKKQASRGELEELQGMFDFKLHECKARLSGICPVRSAIFEMLADELLREVTIDQPERGLLLRRVRDEARMTLEAYQSLHAAASQYGARKLLEGARGCPEMMQRIEHLTAETTSLHKEVKRLEARHASLLRCVDEQISADTKRHNEEKAFLENSRKRLQQHLENVKQMQELERRALAGE